MALATINAIWIGPELSVLHVACLKSFLRHGHRVVLHVYEPPRYIPQGVHTADANNLIPQSEMFYYKKRYDSRGSYGSVAPFCNLMRYELLRTGLGLYVDCDNYCLRPFEDADFIFGWQVDNHVSNAVLKLPPDHPALLDLCRIRKAKSFSFPWLKDWRQQLPWLSRLKLRLSELAGKADPAVLPWTALGSQALTWHLRKYDLLPHAMPFDIFYPVNGHHLTRIIDPGLSVSDLVTRRTNSLHLNNELFRRRQISLADIPAGCPLDEIIKSGTIDQGLNAHRVEPGIAGDLSPVIRFISLEGFSII